jgi:hypothetical protein
MSHSGAKRRCNAKFDASMMPRKRRHSSVYGIRGGSVEAALANLQSAGLRSFEEKGGEIENSVSKRLRETV